MADTGPIEGRYMPHAPPIVGRYGKRPHSRMRHVQLRTVHDLISSPRAFAGRAAPKERLVDSADVPAPRLTARGAQALLLVSRAVGVATNRRRSASAAETGCGGVDSAGGAAGRAAPTGLAHAARRSSISADCSATRALSRAISSAAASRSSTRAASIALSHLCLS